MFVTIQAVFLLILIAKADTYFCDFPQQQQCAQWCDSAHTSDSDAYNCDFDSSEEATEDLDAFEEEKAPITHLPSYSKCSAGWAKTYVAEREGFISVNCGKCSIYKLDVQAMKDTRCDPMVCWGLTLELFSGSKDCLWKNNCILPYSPSFIVWSPPNLPSCLAEVPRMINVDISCLDSGVAIHDVLKGYQAVESAKGRIRSHHDGVRSDDLSTVDLNSHTMDITPPADMRDKWKNYFVMLYIIAAKLNPMDTLVLSDPSSLGSSEEFIEDYNTSSWREGDVYTVNSSTLRFQFFANSSSSSHFDLYFQWFDLLNKKSKAKFNDAVKHFNKSKSKKRKIPTFDMIKKTTTSDRNGIIRSHARHPWNYPRPVVTSRDHVLKKWSSYVHVLQAPKGLMYLSVQANQVDLGKGDILSITGEKLKKPGRYSFSGEMATLNLSVLHTTYPTNSGFLLCYEWSQSQDMTGSKDLCNPFVYRVNHCGTEGLKLLRDKCHIRGSKSRPDNSKGKMTEPSIHQTNTDQGPTKTRGNNDKNKRDQNQHKKAGTKKT